MVLDSVYPPPRMPVTNEGLGWDALLKIGIILVVTVTVSGAVPSVEKPRHLTRWAPSLVIKWSVHGSPRANDPLKINGVTGPSFSP